MKSFSTSFQNIPGQPKGKSPSTQSKARVVMKPAPMQRKQLESLHIISSSQQVKQAREVRQSMNATSRVDRKQEEANSSEGDVAQCKVGFEFQTNFGIKKYVKPFFKQERLENMDKQEVVAKYKNQDKKRPSYRIEADNWLKFNPNQVAEIEFIIEPPVPEGPGGSQKLENLMNFILYDGNRLQGLAEQSEGAPFDLEIQNKKYQILPENRDKKLKANPQVTGGIRLDKLLTMLDTVSDEVPELYDAQLRSIQGHAARMDGQNGSDALKGLITLLVHYLETWEADPLRQTTQQDRYNHALEYAKDGIGLLARSNFAGMFEQLPNQDKQLFNNPAAFSTYVLARAQMPGTEDRYVVDRGVREQTHGPSDQYPLGRGRVKQVGPTRGDWLQGIAGELGNGFFASSKDRLSGSDELQSMGQFGKRQDKVGDGENLNGAILEFRKVKHAMPLVDWKNFALRAHRFISLLNDPQEDD